MVNDKPLVAFAVDAISPAQCTADWEEYGSKPENGNLTAVSLRLATAPEFGESELASYFTVSAYDFKFVNPAGITHSSLDTIATHSCLDAAELRTRRARGRGAGTCECGTGSAASSRSPTSKSTSPSWVCRWRVLRPIAFMDLITDRALFQPTVRVARAVLRRPR
jgi:hypothetical protein